ncbi:hypothetical protein D3C73_1148420 [compost metagenome]
MLFPGEASSLNNSSVFLPEELTLTVVPPLVPFNILSKADSIPALPILSVLASYPFSSYLVCWLPSIDPIYPKTEEAKVS